MRIRVGLVLLGWALWVCPACSDAESTEPFGASTDGGTDAGSESSAGGSGQGGSSPDASAGKGGGAGTAGSAGSSAASCDGITCSGHGACVFAAGLPWCVCERGFHADGTACLADTNPPTGQALYVAINGDDAADGSIEHPFLTIRHALDVVGVGGTIYLRGGVHEVTDRIRVRTAGTAEQPIGLWEYPGEDAIIEFSSASRPCANAEPGLKIETDYWHIKGITVRGACYIGILVEGNYNTVENCVAHDNGDTGIHVGGTSIQTQVINCDAYRNYDPEEHGQDADGFGAKFSVGPGTVFRGCRSWNNSDDGFDFWHADSPIRVEDSWAFSNGINLWNDSAFEGNGNGFKLGQDDGTGSLGGRHIVVGSVAFANDGHGFDENGNAAGAVIINCTSMSNAGRNFMFRYPQTATAPNLLRNNLSLDGEGVVNDSSTASSNSWQLGATVDASDFLSVNEALALVDRLPDGNLPQTDLLRLVAGSDCVDKGEIVSEVQRPYTGAAPDLGAFERP